MRSLLIIALLTVSLSATAAERLTFTKDIAPIVNKNCVSCHRPGEIAPFSFLDYDAARPWAKSIRKAVYEKSMPPWHADSSKTKFLNDRSLPQDEIDLIVKWVDQGAVEGDPSDLPAAPEFNDTWAMGEPDLVFHPQREFVVPALKQEIPYQSIWFEVDIQEDLYVSEWEVRPTERRSVHHANLVRQPKQTKRVGIGTAVMAGGDYIGSYLPGSRPVSYPEGTALRIPKGSSIGIQVHFVGLEEPITSHIRFGVKLAQGRVDKIVRTIGTDHTTFDIAPNQAEYVVDSEVSLLYPLTILSSGIHMHLRGSAYTASAVFPDGTEKLIADIPQYDFNWQSNYELANPIEVPAGTKYHIRAVWDNSAKNPNNPDPSMHIKYGPWTNDEMLNTWSHVVLTEEKLGLKVKDGRVVGKYDDAVDSEHPFLLQSLPGSMQPRKKPSGGTD